MKTKTPLIFILLLLFLLSACVSQNTDLEGTSWNLTMLNGAPPVDNSQPTIIFQDGRVSGNSSCNNYGGEYTATGDKIRFGMMMSTMMACLDDALMDQEQVYLRLLGGVDHWEVNDTQLVFFDGSRAVLVFERQD